MGRFLQKTNIIRDYLEDLVEGRAFWPREIWALYAPGLANLRAKVDAAAAAAAGGAGAGAGAGGEADAAAQEHAARACLNHMIADALQLAPSCLRYMARLRHPEVFRFCAIPQLMSIATLAKLADNADVFTGVVKIRKGLALKLMTSGAASMAAVRATFLRHATEIRDRIPARHAAAHALASRACAEVEALCGGAARSPAAAHADALLLRVLVSPVAALAAAAALAALMHHLWARAHAHAWADGTALLPRITDSWDVAALSGAVACVLFLLACAGVPVVQALGHEAPPSPASSPSAAAGADGKVAADAE
jgi:farnesyl-diphosphate farnesyltransferase